MIFNVALFGLGNVGFKYDKYAKNKSYLTHYSTIKNLDGFKLSLAIDNDKNNRKEFEKITKIKAISTDELPRGNKKIDIVIIATPLKTHIEIIKKAVILKPKFILCEKPLSLSNIETKDIIKLCSFNKINLELNYFRRFEKSAVEIKKKLNNISFFRATVFYSNGFINNGSHFLDLITYWFGKPKNIFLKKQNGILTKSYKDYDLDFELNYGIGDVNFFSWKENLYSNYSIRIYTDLFKIDYDINGYKTTMHSRIDDPEYKGFKRLNEESIIIKNNLSNGFKPIYLKIYSNMEKMVETDFNKIQIVPKIINRILKQI
tara:strand:+ start:671 stop:1621 length:951 start_codon:yes stop_codon:yes gene_type:complete